MATAEPERKPTLFERRAERLALPSCPACEEHDTHVATRTDYVLYLRCPSCFNVWSIVKPGTPPLGS